MPVGCPWPEAACASVSQNHCVHSTSTPPARSSASRPQERSSSIVRRLIVVARGRADSVAAALDEQAVDAMARERGRRHQPRGAGADDQHRDLRDLLVAHDPLPQRRVATR